MTVKPSVPLAPSSGSVQRRHRCVLGDAAPEVEGSANIACPQRVTAASIAATHPRDLSPGVHSEGAGSVEPELVAVALEELQERVAVAGGAVAEARAFDERACAPNELASCKQQLGEFLVVRRDRSERGDDSGCAVAPLSLDRS